MKLLGVINKLEDINNFPLDGIVLGCKYSTYTNHIFKAEEILNIIESTNKEIFILINFIMHVDDTLEVSKFIDIFKDKNVKFIFQDLGIFNLLMKKGIIDKGIYNPLTMITNYLDLSEYTSLGCDAVGLSSEITLDDVIKSTTYNPNIFYLGFGYHPMYQTYRKIISLYKEESNLDISLDNLYLQENTRSDDRCPTIENSYGTIVFRNGVISILERIDEINVKYLFLDGIFLKEDIYLKVIDIYQKVINKELDKETGLKMFNELKLNVANQFMYNDSVYNPKEFE